MFKKQKILNSYSDNSTEDKLEQVENIGKEIGWRLLKIMYDVWSSDPRVTMIIERKRWLWTVLER